jgi:Mg/Co/Ni transporter MgtE
MLTQLSQDTGTLLPHILYTVEESRREKVLQQMPLQENVQALRELNPETLLLF